MDKQAAFNKALKGITEQGKLSLEGKSCRYVSKDGCKCSIGHLIPPERYDASIEGKSIWQLFSDKGFETIANLMGEDVIYEDVAFLAYLQGAHDEATSIEDFKILMSDIARNWDLKT